MKRATETVTTNDTSKKPRTDAVDTTSSATTAATTGFLNDWQGLYPYHYQDPYSYAYQYYQYAYPSGDTTTFVTGSNRDQLYSSEYQAAFDAILYPPQPPQLPQPDPSDASTSSSKKKNNETQQKKQQPAPATKQAKTAKPTKTTKPTKSATSAKLAALAKSLKSAKSTKSTILATPETPKSTVPIPKASTSAKHSLPPELRTIYIGNVPDGATMEEILDLVTTGNVEEARQVLKKRCAFVTFVAPDAAATFLKQGMREKWRIRKQELRFSWAALTPVVPQIVEAVQSGVTRCLCVANLDQRVSKESLRNDCVRWGKVESVKMVVDRNVAFVYFASIKDAIAAKAALALQHGYAIRRLGFGVDRCAKFAPQRTFLGPPGRIAESDNERGNGSESLKILTAQGKRSLYLGNLEVDTPTEEICNVIRGGQLSWIKHRPKRKIAFVCFVDPEAAAQFLEYATTWEVKIKMRTLRVGWSDERQDRLPVDVIQAYRMGATRTVYIGSVQDLGDEGKLRKDFEEFGAVEKVNILKDQDCAFVNFLNVLSAVAAVQRIKVAKPEYDLRRIAFGKDRCSGQLPAIRARSTNSGGEQSSTHASATKDNSTVEGSDTDTLGEAKDANGELPKEAQPFEGNEEQQIVSSHVNGPGLEEESNSDMDTEDDLDTDDDMDTDDD
ncbi:hypothetical protein BGX29_008955 [Mortierella sp. GBA35]|nr:hypothetical protein BGX29_008955 [Mortierella sp. GBA35]